MLVGQQNNEKHLSECSSPHAVKASPKHGGPSGFGSNKKNSSSPHVQNSNSHVPAPTLPGSMPMLDDLGLTAPVGYQVRQVLYCSECVINITGNNKGSSTNCSSYLHIAGGICGRSPFR